MSPGIGNRIRRLAGCDRLLLLLPCGWAILGLPGNYLHQRHRMDGTAQFLQILTMILWAAIAGVVAYSVIRRQRRPADYGFSFQRGGLASLAMLAVIHIYLVISGKFVLSATGNYLRSEEKT